MSKACCTTFTSFAGSRPAFVMPAYSSNSLPYPQLPTFLPLKPATSVTEDFFSETCRVPERWKICATSVILAPCSRDASAFGTQATA